MKRIILVLIFSVMLIDLMSQNYVYDFKGSKRSFKSEDVDIEFTDSSPTVKFSGEAGKEMASGVIAMLPTIVNMGFQLATNILEKRVKRFTAEYTKSKSFLNAGDGTIPNIRFVRTINSEEALSIKFIAHKLEKINGFVYYIEFINLKYSSAKATARNNTFDYSIEIKPTFLINNEKKVILISPVAVTSVHFATTNKYPDLKHRTDIIPLPQGAFLTEISLKIVESNPVRVRAEKILSVWNTYKDSTKTIINNFLPEEKKDGSSTNQTGGNTSTGNDQNKDPIKK
jgi:hypothetical protein